MSFAIHIPVPHGELKSELGTIQCGYQVTTQSSLTVNMQSKHEGIKYACDQCDYPVITQGILTQHTKYKHECVKFACTQCDHQFRQQGSLTIHIQSKHVGVKYFCDQCDFISVFIFVWIKYKLRKLNQFPRFNFLKNLFKVSFKLFWVTFSMICHKFSVKNWIQKLTSDKYGSCLSQSCLSESIV